MIPPGRSVPAVLAIVFLLCCSLASAAEQEDYSKIVVISLAIDHGTVTEKSVSMRYGHPPNTGLQPGDFAGVLRTSQGKTITSFDIWDPRIQLSDVLTTGENATEVLGGREVYSDTADFLIVLPYYHDTMTFDLYDKKTGTLVKSVNLSPAIAEFTDRYPRDPGGIPVPGSQQVNYWFWLILGTGVSVLMVLFYISIFRGK